MVTKSQVKYIQSLGQKKFREEENAFVAEGPKIINELLETMPDALLGLYYTGDWVKEHPALTAKIPAALRHEVTDAELEKISFLTTPNKVLAVVRKPAPAAPQPAGVITLMLDGIQDPGNMGTIIRIADWFGIRQLICSPDCADAFAPKVVQGTMGSITRVQVLYTPLEAFIEQNPSVKRYAATLGGQSPARLGRLEEGILIIGNESKGISPALLAASHTQVTIPRIGHAESLNAAVATGILLSHLVSCD
ncbi:MAG: RNA methyltransferase [Bacteroidetes bacterium]|nr:RNA methyltransferase [Bacteroidota bacterium]